MDCPTCGAIMELQGHTDWGAMVWSCPRCRFVFVEHWDDWDDEDALDWLDDDELPTPSDGLPF